MNGTPTIAQLVAQARECAKRLELAKRDSEALQQTSRKLVREAKQLLAALHRGR